MTLVSDNVAARESESCEGTCAHTNCLFEQPWWLDAVAPSQWREIMVEKGGEVFARMTYFSRKKFGLTLSTNPPLTPTLGPWLRPTEGKYATRLAMQHELLGELIEQLPNFDLFSQNLSGAVSNVLPFHWRGYDHFTRYTYQLADLRDLEQIEHGFSEACRRTIRKAQKQLTVQDNLSIQDFYRIVEKTWLRQGRKPNVGRDLLIRLDEVCRRRGQGRIFHAEDVGGNIHAAVYIVWDERSAYYLLGGADPEFRSSGAHSLLMWCAIQFAAEVTRVFDFEGSMNQQIERFFRSFGPRQATFIGVRRISRRLAALTAVKELGEACAGGRRLRWFF